MLTIGTSLLTLSKFPEVPDKHVSLSPIKSGGKRLSRVAHPLLLFSPEDCPYMVRPRSLVGACVVLILASLSLSAGDLRIPLPKRSKYTPVQALNRDGVKAVQNHQYDKAKKLFYKAYLIDPDDPFTLNNLGYMAELDGDIDRARRFYALSADMNSDAVIDKSNNELVQGKAVSAVAGHAEDKGLKTNLLNNQAIALLEKDRAPEADLILQKALTVDPQNPFTLNNLGYAKEKEGEIEAAYQFYTAAANRRSQETVEVAIDKDWRGRPISDVARNNARKLNRRLQNGGSVESKVALLNLRGVSALNRNDRHTGRDFIEQAFKLAPTDAFTLNNMGYLAEMDGDRETADFYYERAREANQKNARVMVATRKEVEGKKIGDVADTTDQLVQSQMEAAREARERQGGPVVLRRRDNTVVVDPAKPVEPPHERVSDANGNLVLPPLPRDTMTTTTTAPPSGVQPSGGQPAQPQPTQPSGGLMMPLPENEQPTTVKEGDHDGGMIMPLPDDQQPGVQPPNPQTAPQQQPQPQPQKEGPRDGGMIMPLPDNQQPGAAQPPQTQQPQLQQPQVQQPQSQQPPVQQPQVQQPQTQQPGAVQAPPTVQPTAPPQPAPTTAQPTAPSTQPPPAASQPTPQPQPSNQNPPLLLPPPDKPQGQNNTAQPKHISDMDQPKPKQQTPPSNSSPVTHITDQH
jgi:Flp pilus assembly protein TadD